ncbi:MAG TPA: FtsX-like permease family protein [Gemmatimonadaceae bacterium]|nr:FtsX-like permease family protein [Gemmatimonadaceae bacterium]
MLIRLLTFIRRSLQRVRVSRELDEELQHHVAMEEQQHAARGVPPVEARRRALRDLGGIEQTKEAVRDVRASWVDSLWQDLRYASRTVWRHPGETATIVAMLALGIGLTTAMFTVVDVLILRPVPFQQADQLAMLWMRGPTGGRTTVRPSVLHAWRESGVLTAAEAANPDTALIEVGSMFATRGMARVTPGIFAMLGGVQPDRGRLFDSTDGGAGADDRVLLSADVWRTLYRSDPLIVGQRITVNSESLLVVGVLPAGFRFPAWDTQLWRADAFSGNGGSPEILPRVYVRFAPGITRDDALRVALAAAHAADSNTAKQWPQAEPLVRSDDYYTRAVPVFAASVLFVLAILCANASGLMLGRLSSRQREFAMQTALGAARYRLIRQTLLESCLIGAIATGVGAFLAWALVGLSHGFLPEATLVRTLSPLSINVRTLVATSVIGVAAALLTGMLPAWLGTRVQANASMRVSERSSTETREAKWLTRTLLIGEVALACTLLAGATVLVRSFMNLTRVNRGLDASGITVADLSLPTAVVTEPTARMVISQDVERRVRALPGVQHVAWSRGTPPVGGSFSVGDWIAEGGQTVSLEVRHYAVGPDFLKQFGIPLLAGRNFISNDGVDIVIVGERFGQLLWPKLDPVGRTFRFAKRQYQVVGVAREVQLPTLDARLDAPEFYYPFVDAGGFSSLSITCAEPCANEAQIRHTLASTHPAIRVSGVRTLEAQFREQLARPRAAAALASVFGVIAVLAAAGGLFSVLTNAVSRRRKEFGVRTALGASPANIRGLVLRDGLTVSGVGIVIGAIAAAALAYPLASLQYGVVITDPVNGLLVFSVMAFTGILACWRPAAQAVRADPSRLLRED